MMEVRWTAQLQTALEELRAAERAYATGDVKSASIPFPAVNAHRSFKPA